MGRNCIGGAQKWSPFDLVFALQFLDKPLRAQTQNGT
jgi:hypothetical protein